MNQIKPKQIHLHYFSLFRDITNVDEETRITQASTLADLYEELNQIYNFPLPLNSIRLAINYEYSETDEVFSDQDTIVFIPPISGGSGCHLN